MISAITVQIYFCIVNTVILFLGLLYQLVINKYFHNPRNLLKIDNCIVQITILALISIILVKTQVSIITVVIATILTIISSTLVGLIYLIHKYA